MKKIINHKTVIMGNILTKKVFHTYAYALNKEIQTLNFREKDKNVKIVSFNSYLL